MLAFIGVVVSVAFGCLLPLWLFSGWGKERMVLPEHKDAGVFSSR